jgi:predicted GIY-YIG superfamily endonuclease
MTGKRYVGITGNLARRLKEHASGSSKAGQLIGAFTLLHTEDFPDHRAARSREKFLKGGQGRKQLDEIEAASRPAGGG